MPVFFDLMDSDGYHESGVGVDNAGLLIWDPEPRWENVQRTLWKLGHHQTSK